MLKSTDSGEYHMHSLALLTQQTRPYHLLHFTLNTHKLIFLLFHYDHFIIMHLSHSKIILLRNGSVIILFRIIMESFSNVTTQELAIMISMPRTVHTLILSSMNVEGVLLSFY